MNLPDLRMRLLTERVAQLAGERTGVSKSNSYRLAHKTSLLHLPLSDTMNMGYFGILSSLEGLLK